MPKPLLSYLGQVAAGYARRLARPRAAHADPTRLQLPRRRVQSIGKHPRTRHGVRDITTDLEQITIWWRQWPNANVGIATGQPSGLHDVAEHAVERLASRR